LKRTLAIDAKVSCQWNQPTENCCSTHLRQTLELRSSALCQNPALSQWRSGQHLRHRGPQIAPLDDRLRSVVARENFQRFSPTPGQSQTFPEFTPK
jgi:hypothetical protein